MWSPRLPAEFKVFASLMALGALLGNIFILSLAMVPLCFVIFSLLFDGPKKISVRRRDPKIIAHLDDSVPVVRELEVGEGVGIVILGEVLPQHMKLSAGSDLSVFWKGPAPLRVQTTYDLECTRRGFYEVGPARLESLHFSGLLSSEHPVVEGSGALLVQQRRLDVKRMRDPRLRSRIPLPVGAISKLGSMTTDFKEIREYRPGDLYKNINWKATMRLVDISSAPPLVNEFEREGRRTVWIFIDAGPQMSVGTTVRNAFEHAVSAATSIAEFYLAMNCHVGVEVCGENDPVLPDCGRRQKARIARRLLKAEVGRGRVPLRSSVRELRGHIAGTSPLFIFITSVDGSNLQSVRDVILEMRLDGGPRSQVMAIDIDPLNLGSEGEEDDLGAELARLARAEHLRRIRATGAYLVSWNPVGQDLRRVLIAGLRRRGRA
jgi:uncharacterized protein (DUF58 family)